MAANDVILVTTQGKSLSAQICSTANQLRSVKSGVNDIANILAHFTDGIDFSKIEQQLGLSVGDGVKLYNLVNTLQTQINGSSAVADFSTKVISIT